MEFEVNVPELLSPRIRAAKFCGLRLQWFDLRKLDDVNHFATEESSDAKRKWAGETYTLSDSYFTLGGSTVLEDVLCSVEGLGLSTR